MTCAHCGCDMAMGAQFCPRCGQRSGVAQDQTWAPVGGYAPSAFANDFLTEKSVRVEHHAHLLGLAWCGYGALQLVMGAALTSVFHLMGPHFHGAAPLIGSTSFVFAALALLAGVGLLARKPWARGLAVFLGILSLFKIPVGTGLGVYTLWVLGGQQGKASWRRLEMA